MVGNAISALLPPFITLLSGIASKAMALTSLFRSHPVSKFRKTLDQYSKAGVKVTPEEMMWNYRNLVLEQQAIKDNLGQFLGGFSEKRKEIDAPGFSTGDSGAIAAYKMYLAGEKLDYKELFRRPFVEEPPFELPPGQYHYAPKNPFPKKE